MSKLFLLATRGVDCFFFCFKLNFIIYFFFCLWTRPESFSVFSFFFSSSYKRMNIQSHVRIYLWLAWITPVFFPFSCPTAGPLFFLLSNSTGWCPSRTRTLFVRQCFHNHWRFFCAFDTIWTYESFTDKILVAANWFNQSTFFFPALTQLGPNQSFPEKKKTIQRENKKIILPYISCVCVLHSKTVDSNQLENNQPGGRVLSSRGGENDNTHTHPRIGK